MAPISQVEKRSRFGEFKKGLARFVRTNPTGALGALIVIVLVITASLCPEYCALQSHTPGAPRLLPPSLEHLMGTDGLGRDIFRVLFMAHACHCTWASSPC